MTAGIDGGLSLRHLHAVRDGRPVLTDVSLDVRPGEILAVLGASGAGKSALLRVLAGLAPADSGQVLVAGRDVTAADPRGRDAGYVPQELALSPRLTVRAHLASPLRARRVRRVEMAQRVAGAAALLQIGAVLDRPAGRISRADAQRTALARALVAEPPMLLLDDPLRHFDSRARYQMRLDLPRLLRRPATATIYATQDCREAMAVGDRIAVLIGGRVVQDDVAETVHEAPASVAVARLLGDPPMNLLACHVSGEGSVEALGLRFPCDAGECLMGVRPQDVAVLASAHPRGAPVELVTATPQRERVLLLLRTRTGEELLASICGAVPRPGAPLWAVPDPARTLLFDAASGARIPLLELRETEAAA